MSPTQCRLVPKTLRKSLRGPAPGKTWFAFRGDRPWRSYQWAIIFAAVLFRQSCFAMRGCSEPSWLSSPGAAGGQCRNERLSTGFPTFAVLAFKRRTCRLVLPTRGSGTRSNDPFPTNRSGCRLRRNGARDRRQAPCRRGLGSLRKRRSRNREAPAHGTGDGSRSGSGGRRPQRFAASRHRAAFRRQRNRDGRFAKSSRRTASFWAESPFGFASISFCGTRSIRCAEQSEDIFKPSRTRRKRRATRGNSTVRSGDGLPPPSLKKSNRSLRLSRKQRTRRIRSNSTSCGRPRINSPNCSPPMERNLANATRSFKGTCTRPGGDWDSTFPCRQRR